MTEKGKKDIKTLKIWVDPELYSSFCQAVFP